jgi:hypothetical protein
LGRESTERFREQLAREEFDREEWEGGERRKRHFV